jgi:threonine/homoserine/homoserine lactone efflux protein
MMLHVTVFSLVYQTALVLIGNVVSERLKVFSYARQLANQLAGITLIGLSAKLASNIR